MAIDKYIVTQWLQKFIYLHLPTGCFMKAIDWREIMKQSADKNRLINFCNLYT